MAEESPKSFVILYRGGIADRQYGVAVGRVPALVEVSVDGDDETPPQLYAYRGEEAQVRHVNKYNPQSRQNERTAHVEAYFQIFTPAAEARA